MDNNLSTPSNTYNNDDDQIRIIKEEYFSRLMEFLPAAIFTCDKEGKLTYYNKKAVEFWEYTPELDKNPFFAGWKAYKLDGTPLAPEDSPMLLTIKHGKSFTDEIILESPSGVKKYVQPFPKPLFNTSGSLIGVLNMHIDISQRFQLKQQAMESEMRHEILQKKRQLQHQRMIEEVQDYAIIMLDSDGNIISWNKGAEKIKGYRSDEILGNNFRTFYFPKDVEDKMPDGLLEQARTFGKAMHEGWRRRKDNSKFWGSVVITALHDDNGDVVGYTKVTRDLTERKLAEEKIKQYMLDLEQKNTELEQYASIASHDLQEPLRKIEVYTGMLKAKLSDENAAEVYADKIISATQRMSKLVKEILLYTRTNNEMSFGKIDINSVLNNIVNDLEILITEKNANIIFKELPAVTGISVQLYQLFYNLIVNSLKFSDNDTEIVVSCTNANEDEIKQLQQLSHEIPYYKFKVSDNGKGFNPVYKEKVFEMFERLDSNEKGTGIGLALCKKIAQLHHGFIQARSEENVGTDIIIYLPA